MGTTGRRGPRLRGRHHAGTHQLPRLDRRLVGGPVLATRRTSRRSAPPSSATWPRSSPSSSKRNVKVIGLSVDATDDHEAWADDIEETQGTRPNYPIIGDADFNVSKLYGMLPASTSGDAKTRTPADNQTVRNVFVIGPDKKIKLILVYPMTTGPQLRRGAARHRLAPAHRQAQGRDAGELEAGRGRHHRRLGVQRRGEGDLRHAGRSRSRTSASSRSRADHLHGPRRRDWGSDHGRNPAAGQGSSPRCSRSRLRARMVRSASHEPPKVPRRPIGSTTPISPSGQRLPPLTRAWLARQA